MSPDEQRIHAALRLGHPGALAAALADGAVGSAWLGATQAAARVLGSAGVDPPRCEPSSTPPERVRRARWLAASLGARLALTELRPGDAMVFTERARALLDAELASERIECGKLELWADIASGGERSMAAEFELLLQDARTHHESAHVVELTALNALNTAERGHLDAATREARLASRMARTEEMPQPAALANVILARIRRLAGSPYLGATIASGLRRFAPSSFHPWLDWELVLAAGVSAPLPSDIGAVADALRACLLCLFEGDRAPVSESIARLAGDECALVSADAARLRAALLPGATPEDDDEALFDWWSGAEDALPHGLAGICPASASAHGAIAVAVSSPNASYRLLSAGTSLLGGARVTRLSGEGEAQQRVLGVLAALALAGREGLTEADLFRRVYSFAYKPELHRGAFNTVLHRARACLADAGQLVREDGVARLLHEDTLVVFDPRCRLGARDRVLRQLATTPRVGARQIAAELQLPLRSVQAILSDLTGEGLCASSRSGRRVEYRVEDTTFHEPTAARARTGPE